MDTINNQNQNLQDQTQNISQIPNGGNAPVQNYQDPGNIAQQSIPSPAPLDPAVVSQQPGQTPQQQLPQQPVRQPYIQQPQVPVSGATPEAPASLPERPVETAMPVESSPERPEQSEQIVNQGAAVEDKQEVVQTPDKAPDEKKFESPFKLYGYQASEAAVQKSKSSSARQGRGNSALSQTWLLVLLGRILKIQEKQ